MTPVDNIEPKLEYEIFKRDSFTCKKCGGAPPKVVLYVAYKTPPEEGGTLDPSNLVTMCYECSGFEPLEMLSKRRQQLELMLEWKKAWQNFEDDTQELVFGHIESIMFPRALSDKGKRDISNDIQKYGYQKVIDVISVAADKSLKYDKHGDATKDSAEAFINNIHRFLAHKAKSPIEQRIGYVCGICNNLFPRWNRQKGMALLHRYVRALQQYGMSENQIVVHFEEKVYSRTKDCTSLAEWCEMIENSIDSTLKEAKELEGSEQKAQESSIPPKHYPEDTVKFYAYMDGTTVRASLDILLRLFRKGKLYTPERERELRHLFLSTIYNFLIALRKQYLELGSVPDSSDRSLIENARNGTYSYQFFAGEEGDDDLVREDIDDPLSSNTEFYIAESFFDKLLEDSLDAYFYPQWNYDFENSITMIEYLIADYQHQLYGGD